MNMHIGLNLTGEAFTCRESLQRAVYQALLSTLPRSSMWLIDSQLPDLLCDEKLFGLTQQLPTNAV